MLFRYIQVHLRGMVFPFMTEFAYIHIYTDDQMSSSKKTLSVTKVTAFSSVLFIIITYNKNNCNYFFCLNKKSNSIPLYNLRIRIGSYFENLPRNFNRTPVRYILTWLEVEQPLNRKILRNRGISS